MIEKEYYMGQFIAREQGRIARATPGIIKALQLSPRFKPLLSALALTTLSPGVDVSKWQDFMTWATTKAAGAKFAYIKMTQGNTIKDIDAIENMRNSKGCLLRGGYHFMANYISGITQADYMLDFMRDEVGDYGDLPVCADVEVDITSTIVKDFVYRVYDRLGYYPVIYTSIGKWARVTGDKSWAVLCPLWAAHWYVDSPSIPSPWTDWAIHQYTNQGTGSVWGASSNYIDLDRGKDFWLNQYIPPPPPDVINPIKTVVVSAWTSPLYNDANTAVEIGKLTKAQRLPVTKVSEDGEYLKVEAWIPSANCQDV